MKGEVKRKGRRNKQGADGVSNKDDAFSFDFDENSLAGRVVLVAGGTGGLGSATVALLARDGATVVAGYRGDRARAEALKQAMEAQFKATIHLVEGDIS